MSHLHHVDSETPEEDVVPMGHVMTSVLYPTVFYVPSYTRWLQDHHPQAVDVGVQYLHHVLERHFRARASSPTLRNVPWILKTPQHLFEMPLLKKHFGNVRFIWLHREPLEAMSSVISVVCAMIGIGTDALKDGAWVRKVATDTVQFWKWALKQAENDRDTGAIASHEILDVQFEDLVRDPLAMVKHIYQHHGLILTVETEQRMSAFIREWHHRGFSGKHKHSLERFGVETKALRREMVDRWWIIGGK
jgi:hypothetical protein